MMKTVFSGRVPLLVAGVFLLMMPGASAAPQFVPPNGLPLDTPLGQERNADGSAVISFRTMGREIAQNATAIGALADQSVTKDALTAALAPYLTGTAADARYATPDSVTAAVRTETDRATKAEQGQADALAALQADTVTKDALTTALAPYQTQTEASETYLPKAGGAITGDITATPDLWGATAHFGGKSLYGQFSGPGGDLGQGTALGWNELNGIPGAVLYGETDFYNLHGTGSGGYTFCDGGTAAECKSNIVLSIASNGAAWLRSLTLAGSTGAGNGFACLDGTGKLYRDSSAPCVTSYVDPKYATPQTVTDAVQAETDRAEATYLPKTGGTVQTLAISASFTPPKMTYEQATASACAVGTIYYITNGQKFWSNASFAGANNSQVLIASDTGQEGGFYGCVPIGSGQTRIIPLVMNYNGGAR